MAEILTTDDDRSEVAARWRRTRRDTERLAAPLSVEDQLVQSMPDVSPTKWHLAHTTWFWETFFLKPFAPGHQAASDAYGYLFNSYYEHEGPRHPRSERGMLSRPPLADVMAYRARIDAAMEPLVDRLDDQQARIVELGIAHEEQHQELIVTDIKHVLSKNPTSPAAYPAEPFEAAPEQPMTWTAFEGGVFEFGAGDESFFFDNERPRHRQVVEPFLLGDRPVSNADWIAFVSDGGYDTATLWLADGWAAACQRGWDSPLHWRRIEGVWHEYTLHGQEKLDLSAPVSHVSYYEAAAYAEWSGERLPDERELELAARSFDPEVGRFASPGLSRHPRGLAAPGLRQVYGDVWEWTRSAYGPYPGYRSPPGAIGEYNGKFMSGQMVLKGGSCATPRGHMRPSYRNFFPPDARWQFSGVRLAKDI